MNLSTENCVDLSRKKELPPMMTLTKARSISGSMPALLVGCLLLVNVAVAQKAEQKWVSELGPATAGAFPVLPDIELQYDFGWSGVKAAEALVTFEQGSGSAASMSTSLKTTGAARVLWSLNAEGSSSVDVRSMRPRRAQQVERYRKEIKAHRIDFGEAEVVFTPLKVKGRSLMPDGRPETVKAPRPFDMSTALLFFRSQRMQRGDVYRVVTMPGKTPYLATLTVGKREKRKSKLGELDTIRCDLKLERINSKWELSPHKRVKSTTIWITNDALRLPLRIEADVFIGHVFTELQSIELLDGSPSPYVISPESADE